MSRRSVARSVILFVVGTPVNRSASSPELCQSPGCRWFAFDSTISLNGESQAEAYRVSYVVWSWFSSFRVVTHRKSKIEAISYRSGRRATSLRVTGLTA